MLAGVGLGNMTQNLCALSIIYGLNMSVETLVSQAAGAGDLRLCGTYLNRGRVILTAIFLPIAVVLMNSFNILMALGQD